MYDIDAKRVGKMLKLMREYLHWIQNSVFEGEITDVKLKELKMRAKELMNNDTDSLIIFKSRDEKWLDKEIIGEDKNPLDTML